MHEFVTHGHTPACLAHSLCGEAPWAWGGGGEEPLLMQMKLQQSPRLGFRQEMESDFRLVVFPVA